MYQHEIEVRGRIIDKDHAIQPGFHNAVNIIVTNVNSIQEFMAIASESHDNLVKCI